MSDVWETQVKRTGEESLDSTVCSPTEQEGHWVWLQHLLSRRSTQLYTLV